MDRKTMCQMALTAAAATMLLTSVPLCASESDDKIESSFKETYVYKTYLKGDDLSADAKNGVVTLTGTVAEESHKALAQDTAAGLPGVTSVDNKLATTAEVATEKSDKWIGRKINLSLLFHRNVNASATTAEVKDGVVTLKGEASSMAQKELTAEYAKDIDGVKSVKNDMTVATPPKPAEQTAGEKIDDASVTAQVKAVLLTHRSTSSIKTKGVTLNGVVTLTGIANNAATKSLVTKLATDVKGVVSVDNQMTIE